MRLLLRIIAIATVPAWMCFHAGPGAAQTFDERWSIVPKAHAESAPPAPHAEPAPATPEEKKPDPQAQQPPIGGESVHGSEGRSDTRSLNRIFSGKASYYSYQTEKQRAVLHSIGICQPQPTAACRSARKFALLILRPTNQS
jgi:rare lipoprotein A